MAAPPTAGSLPGAFTTNTMGTTYTGTGSAAAIVIGTGTTPGGQVLQFGGATAGTAVSPTNTTTGAALSSATNSGFSVGSGAALTISGAAALPTLINDQSGSASQVYGSVNASGLGGPLFVANSNGVVVGAGGSFTGPADGTGLLGYSVDSTAFGTSGAITVNSSTAGAGSVTVDPAATLNGTGTLLVASNGAVSIGAAPAAGVEVIAGYGLSTDPTGAVTPGALLPSSTATVAFSGGSAATPLDVIGLGAAGSVTNSGIMSLTATSGLDAIIGSFTNTGIATVAGLTAGSINNAGTLNDSTGTLTTVAATGTTSGADITNTGIINESAGTFTAIAGATGATGNFNNTGKINFTTAVATGTDGVSITASNINMAGSIAATLAGGTAPTALSATNALGPLALTTVYTGTPAGTALAGDIDYATTAYAATPSLTAGAVRVLAGGLYNPAVAGAATITVGSGTIADPFTGTTLVNNLSLFPGSTVQADGITVAGTATTATQAGSNINLDGVLSTQVAGGTSNSITFGAVNNITGAGGLAFNDGGVFTVTSYTGNINNPNGAAAAGSTAFQYNYLPIAVANSTSGTAGTVNISLTGQSASSGTVQLVNVLTTGNAVLVNTGTPPLTPPASTTGITPASTYTNNHLVVQATGNIGFSSSGTSFYWPGLVYLNTVASATTPTMQSTGGSITLGTLTSPSTAIALNNVLPAAVTGGAGIFLETNNLNLDGSTVTTNANSWVNFVSTQVASAYATTSPSSFFNAYVNAITPSVSQLSIQALPTGSFQ